MNRLLIFILLFLSMPMIEMKMYDKTDFYPETIEVQIDGAVNNRGSYIVKQGSTVNDLINERVITLSDRADTTTLNLNYVLSDNDVIVIDEVCEDKLISINNASLEDLCELDGIGEVTAARIIQYREENGKFQYLEELMLINGIKESKFKQIKDFICL